MCFWSQGRTGVDGAAHSGPVRALVGNVSRGRRREHVREGARARWHAAGAMGLRRPSDGRRRARRAPLPHDRVHQSAHIAHTTAHYRLTPPITADRSVFISSLVNT